MMNLKTIQPDKSISLFVKNILLFEEDEKDKQTTLPFFADGYPGLIFHEAGNGLSVQPHNKKMPQLFLYGQTIHPIELHFDGRYKMIIFQLYPFILKSFFNIEAIDINDNCFDLKHVKEAELTIDQLAKTKLHEQRIDIIRRLLVDIFELKKQQLDLAIKHAIQIIVENKGLISSTEICSKAHLTVRTFERRFLHETGITPKQFSKIIQFQESLTQLTLKDYSKLSDIVYQNGFADQSHFIRVFKAFTGKTPSRFLQQSN